jgi:hypothetical protein
LVHEAKQSGRQAAIETKGGTRQGTAAQRANIRAVGALLKPLTVAFEHLDVREQMMSKVDWLGPLKVCVTGKHHFALPMREVDQRGLKCAQFLHQLGGLIAQPKPHIEGYLVIARTTRMELGSGGHTSSQFRFDVHVNILEFLFPGKGPSFNVGRDFVQTAQDGATLRGTEQANFFQHGGMRTGADDVMPPQAPIEGERFSKTGDIGGRPLAKPAAARNGRLGLVAFQTGANVGENEGKVTEIYDL